MTDATTSAAPVITVSYLKSWEGVPILEPEGCAHPGSETLAIGQQLAAAGRGGGQRATTSATLCMLCGTDTTGQMTSEDAHEACWLEHGWNAPVHDRLMDLVDHDLARLARRAASA